MIAISDGLICGYDLSPILGNDIDLNSIDATNFKRVNLENKEFNELKKIIPPEISTKLNPTDVYKISLQGRDFFHLFDLEDGDFIGFGQDKQFYKITHDPFEIVLLDEPIETFLV